MLGNLVAPEGAFDIVRIGGSIAALEKRENKTRTEKKEKNPSRQGAVAHGGTRGESAAALRGASGAVVGDAERGV